MDLIFTILSLVMLVLGILQIILFFKIWGMTNNVKKINQRQEQVCTLLQSIASKIPNSIPNIPAPQPSHSTSPQNLPKEPIVANIHLGSISGLDEDSGKKLENAIRNGQMQEARYILMMKCKVSLEKADEIIKSAQK